MVYRRPELQYTRIDFWVFRHRDLLLTVQNGETFVLDQWVVLYCTVSGSLTVQNAPNRIKDLGCTALCAYLKL